MSLRIMLRTMFILVSYDSESNRYPSTCTLFVFSSSFSYDIEYTSSSCALYSYRLK